MRKRLYAPDSFLSGLFTQSVLRRSEIFKIVRQPFAALFMLVLITASSYSAETPIHLQLNLEGAVKLAQEKNPMLAAARSEVDAAAARTRMAAAQRRPSLSATSFLTNGDMPGILNGQTSVMPTPLTAYTTDRFTDQNTMLMWPMDISGKLSRSVRSAAQRGAAAAIEAERTRQDVVLEVRMVYYDALFQDQRAAIYKSAVEVVKEQLKNDTIAADTGKVPPYYLERDRAEVAMNEQMLAETQREAAQARIRLAALMGLDPETPLELTDTLETPAEGDAPDTLRSEPPDVAAARTSAEAARTSQDAARRAFAPDVSLALMSDRITSTGNDAMRGTTAALIVAVPLWDGGMRRAAVQETNAMHNVALQELRNTELRVRADFQSARLEFETALKNIATADTAIKAAEENHRVAKLRYEGGKGILVEMLDALTALTRARVNRVQAVRDSLVARDMLLRLAGKL